MGPGLEQCCVVHQRCKTDAHEPACLCSGPATTPKAGTHCLQASRACSERHNMGPSSCKQACAQTRGVQPVYKQMCTHMLPCLCRSSHLTSQGLQGSRDRQLKQVVSQACSCRRRVCTAQR